jgi:hypothetical protein
MIPYLNKYINNNEKGALRLINKTMRNAIINTNYTITNHQLMSLKNIKSDKNMFYITQSTLGDIAYLSKICSYCMKQLPCAHNTESYLGILIRQQKNMQGKIDTYKTYISDFRSNEFSLWCNKGLQYKDLFIKSNIHFPRYTNSKDTCTSKPYFNYIGNLYVLEGIPKQYTMEAPKDYIYELELSDANICKYRLTYFSFFNKKYPLTYLYTTPYLLQNFIKHIENGRCNVQREEKETIFSSPDFFKPYLPNEMKFILKEVLEGNWNTLEGALCFKLTGNMQMAKKCLEEIDEIDAQNSSIHMKLGKLNSMTYTEVGRHLFRYPAIKTMLSYIDTLQDVYTLKEQYPTTQIKGINIGYITFLEIRKNGANYSIIPWTHTGYKGGYQSKRKFNLINCIGTIHSITIKEFEKLQWNDFIIKILEVTEQKHNSDQCVTHTITLDGEVNAKGLPHTIYELTQEYVRHDNKNNWLKYKSIDILTTLCKTFNAIQDTCSYAKTKKFILEKFCPDAPDIVYSPNFIDEDNTLTYEQLSDLYIRNNLEKIIDSAIPGLSFDENDYTQEEKLNNAILPLPKTCMQLVSYLDKAVEWHNPSAKLRRAYPNYQKEYWYQFITQSK